MTLGDTWARLHGLTPDMEYMGLLQWVMESPLKSRRKLTLSGCRLAPWDISEILVFK